MRRSALDYALYLLNRRPQSRTEIIQKLQRKKFLEEDIATTVAKLAELDLINDERFAKFYVTDKLEFNRRGRFRLGLELSQKGIDKELRQKVLEDIPPEKELEVAILLLKGRARQWQMLDEQKKYQRSVSLLQRRGFSGAITKAALEAIKNDPA